MDNVIIPVCVLFGPLRTVKAASADDCADACKAHACIQFLSLIIVNYKIVNIIKS